MEEIIATALVGVAYALLMLALAMVPIGVIIGIGLCVVRVVERGPHVSVRDLLIIIAMIAEILAVVAAMIRGYS